MPSDGPDLVAYGRRMRDLPRSPAPMLYAAGFVVYLVAIAAGRGRPLSGYAALVALVALGLFVGGSVVSWLRLTAAGRVLVALPLILGTGSALAGGSGANVLAMALGFAAFALFLTATVVLVDRPGTFITTVFRGGIDPAFVRQHADGGEIECRLERDELAVVSPGGAREATPLIELGKARLTEKGPLSELVIVDVVGDEVLRLRASTPEERRAASALADELSRRVRTR